MMEMTLNRMPAAMPDPFAAGRAVRAVVSGVALGGGTGGPDDEAAHLAAAATLLQRHGIALDQCVVVRERAGFEASDEHVQYVVRVGEKADIFALNEGLTAVQVARGLVPSARLDVVFEP
ncbi:DUF6461 domain-containing protein [Cupriavidus agavae]|uniref:Uncharacterized protein n=1 Tax=Cupriavidus agavae TaxID=1001822 RepID=A0A4Q7S8L4_9BURK|nr:DUF6461 domain-containing protein [Cupriavidus agavae]RZT42745.1 hypothetical protein EV147_1786 [Cupriavidus agavae]